MVIGNRFQGGTAPGASTLLRRYIGAPLLSGIGKLLFRAPISDFHCGLRAFSAAAVRFPRPPIPRNGTRQRNDRQSGA